MRRFFLLCLTLLTTGLTTATTIGQEAAREKAEKLLGKPMVGMLGTTPAKIAPKEQDEAAFFVFNAVDGAGFAIISAEEELGDVLGYSPTGSGSADMPDALRLYLDTYRQYVQQYRQGAAEAKPAAYTRSVNGAGPLLTTQWSQEAPFNNLCPMDGNERSLTGCVATSMAQIMRYWEWPVQGSGYGRATCGTEVVAGALNHFYQWDAMLDTREQLEASEGAAAAVAELMYDCGLAVGMDYGALASGAMSPFKGLYMNFGYSPATLRAYRRDCFESDTEWLDTIFHELDNGRPLYYGASSATAGESGHAFVIDGYDTNALLHVNWGWGGAYDGYYDVTLMNPAGFKFTVDQDIVVGIEPARNGETGAPTEYPYMGVAPICKQKGTISTSVSFDITIGGVCNFGTNAHSWTPSVGLYDTNNQLLSEVKMRGGEIGTLHLDPYTGFTGNMGDLPCSLASKTVADGHYALRIIFKENGSWILPDTKGGQKNNAIYIEVSGKRLTFTDGTAYLEALQTSGIKRPAEMPEQPQSTRYYNLQGREAGFSTKGVMIVKHGNAVRKIVR